MTGPALAAATTYEASEIAASASACLHLEIDT